MASPGNRLSHLARRRAIFSSANLQSRSQLSNLSKLGRKPCVIDASSTSSNALKYLTKKGLVKHMKHKHQDEDSILPDPTSTQLRTLEKFRKQRGESYMSRDGVIKSGKSMGPLCKHCIYKCPVQISNEQRELLFNSFYDLGSIQKQWEYIAKCIVRTETKHRRIDVKPNRKRRENNLSYYFQLDHDRIRVCKTFMINTLGICNTVVRTVLKKCNENGEVMVGDRRESTTFQIVNK